MNWWDAPIIQQYKWSFGLWWTHSGIDLGMPYGTPLTSPVNGVVIAAGCHPWGGQVDIRTTLEDGKTHVLSFLHLSQIAGQLGMHIGETITAGTVIGYSGGLPQGVCPTERRYSNIAHLHFEMTWGQYAPYDSAEGHYYNPDKLPFNPLDPACPNANQHPEDPNALLQAIRDGDGQVTSGSSGGASGGGGPTPGQQAHSILDSVPGFAGICQALDAIEQFEPFNPPNSTVGIGPFQTANPLDNFGYAVAWTARNAMVIAVRLLITGVGLGLLWLLFLGLLAANRWVQEAGGLAAAAAIGAV